jgi:hypothetical protein
MIKKNKKNIGIEQYLFFLRNKKKGNERSDDMNSLSKTGSDVKYFGRASSSA